ncbi:MAG: ATP-grasp domain-containing protein [Alphaproteobacteria bacterium]|nr:ATP-grasp domain-containing protein [Alphaproteobacteria bacterium]
MAPGTPPKILIVTTVHWPATTRLALALAHCGFAVGAVTPAHHVLRRFERLAARFVCHPHVGLLRAVAAAIERWSPDLVIPADDRAVTVLHRLHARAGQGQGRDPGRLRGLIEASLGDPRYFELIEKKSEFMSLAAAEGVVVPETVVVRDLDELRRWLSHATFPQVLKVDGSWGGEGVRIVRSSADAEQAFAGLAARPGWLRIGKQILQHLNFAPLRERLRDRAPTVSLQAYIPGRPANRAVACWRGEVLAGASVEVVQASCDTGPASVVRVIDHPGMADATARLVRRLGLSGFCGVDFILDASGQAHLIELNARTTTICYLALDAQSDMTGALYAKLARTAQRPLASTRHDLITFFPHELWRDPKSTFLAGTYHDVPWDEPQFVAAYLKPDPPGWVDRLHQVLRPHLGRPDPALADMDAEPLKREG